MNKVSVIMTCRNEEGNIEEVLNALDKQTIVPNEVVIVDDGSTDNTFEILKKFSSKNNWIIKRRKGDDDRYWSIVNGLKIASSLLKKDFNYLMVLDADTILEPDYIKKIIEKFDSNLSLGIAGGDLIYNGKNSSQFLKGDNVVFGCNRIYSKKCWKEINNGNIINVTTIAWDPEHTLLSKVRGFDVLRFDDIKSKSIRPPSLKVSSVIEGMLQYQFGYSFSTTLISCLFHLKFNFLKGYILAWLSKKKRIDNEDNLKKIKNYYNKEFWRRNFKKFN